MRIGMVNWMHYLSIQGIQRIDLQKQLSCIGLVLYKNKFYRLRAEEADGYSQTTFSDNYASLPVEVKENVERYWNNLDKR